MIDLIGDLLDRPLDRRHARAIVALASCLTLTFAALVGFGVTADSRPTGHETRAEEDPGRPSAPPPATVAGPSHRSGAESPPAPRRQDPQDRRGSAAFRRARRALREHRALQHLPLRRRGLRVTLVGADRGRAIIRVEAPTLAEAKHRWRRFLRRLGDDGGSYEARFRARRRISSAPRKDRRGDRGVDRGPDRTSAAGTTDKRRYRRDRGARDFLKSPPQSKASL